MSDFARQTRICAVRLFESHMLTQNEVMVFTEVAHLVLDSIEIGGNGLERYISHRGGDLLHMIEDAPTDRWTHEDWQREAILAIQSQDLMGFQTAVQRREDRCPGVEAAEKDNENNTTNKEK